MRRTAVLAVAALAAAVVAAPAEADPVGPPGGMIYAADQVWRTLAPPSQGNDRGPTDTLYVFPDCPDCVAVSDAAPGHGRYNGGRWIVVEAHGITTQLTNAAAVEAAATSLVDTGMRFKCPLIRA